MLAYQPGVAVAYNVGLTLFSLVAATAVTSAGLALAVRGAGWTAPLGGVVVGAGIALMHYTRHARRSNCRAGSNGVSTWWWRRSCSASHSAQPR